MWFGAARYRESDACSPLALTPSLPSPGALKRREDAEREYIAKNKPIWMEEKRKILTGRLRGESVPGSRPPPSQIPCLYRGAALSGEGDGDEDPKRLRREVPCLQEGQVTRWRLRPEEPALRCRLRRFSRIKSEWRSALATEARERELLFHSSFSKSDRFDHTYRIIHMVSPYKKREKRLSSALDDANRSQLEALATDASCVTRVHDVRHVLVALGCLFHHQMRGRDADADALRFEA